MKITVEDYVQHLSQYKFNVFYDPELVHGTTHQFHNEIQTIKSKLLILKQVKTGPLTLFKSLCHSKDG